jgi:hypothetical protein
MVTVSMELQRTPVWSNSPLSWSNSSFNGGLTNSRKLKEFKSCEVASSSTSNEEIDASSEEVKDKKWGEIRDPTTLLLLIMIIYLTLAPSLRYLLVTPPPPVWWDGLY